MNQYRVYANDNDPKIVEWLKCLPIQIDHVCGKSIKDIKGEDLIGYQQCHFFAGIAGWLLALRLAGWPDGLEVWTGSCPCQPFSAAGKGKGFGDERHLWPDFLRLISERKPTTIFGEQVASKAGRDWLSVVFADLEAVGYEVAGADLCAASVGAPHVRQRLFWVAHALRGGTRKEPGELRSGSRASKVRKGRRQGTEPRDRSTTVGMANSSSARLAGRSQQSARQEQPAVERGGDACGMEDAGSGELGAGRFDQNSFESTHYTHGSSVRLGNPTGSRSLSSTQSGVHSDQEVPRARNGELERSGSELHRLVNAPASVLEPLFPSPARGDEGVLQECQSRSSDADTVEFVLCRDGKARPIKSGLCALAHGVPGRVAQLRGLGNAIVPQVAAEFVSAFMESLGIEPSFGESV